jgi:hypothetical protein
LSGWKANIKGKKIFYEVIRRTYREN